MLKRLIVRIWEIFSTRMAAFGRDAGVILAARMLQNVNGFLLSVIIVRKFGLAAAGSLTIATIATVILGTFCTFGLPYIFVREDAPHAVRNSMGLASCLLGVFVAIPFCIALGGLLGRDLTEALVIVFLSFAGPFFAQTNIANALLVLQDRATLIILAPLGNLAGLICGYLFTDHLLTFSIILSSFRFVGTFTILLCLPLTAIRLADLYGWMKRGLRFLTADVINLGGDQASVMIASYLLIREDLGIFGLCRQMLTLCDTPGWSRLVAWYPQAYEDPRGNLPRFKRQMLKLGIFCTVCVAALCVPLGLWIYHLPKFAWMAPLILCSEPFRYLIGIYDMGLRAIGAVRATNKVTLIRCAINMALLSIGIAIAGIYGAIFATILQSIVGSWLTSMILAKNMPNIQRQSMDRADAIGKPIGGKVGQSA